MSVTPIEALLKRDRAVVLYSLILISILAWAYLLYQARGMNNMEMKGAEMAMPQMQAWQAFDFLMIFTMWAVMMVAMMVPTAAPMVILFAAFNRKRREQQRPFVPTGVFLLGYLVMWTVFSLLATIAQWEMHNAALLSAMMVSTSPMLGGVLLLSAGIFQLTPLKNSCLTHCRSPLSFISTHWRDGRAGAFLMGLKHGIYCVGCCWVLMCLLFVTGVMNVLWIALIAAFVLVEKVVPAMARPWVSRSAGVAFIVWGLSALLKVMLQRIF